MSARTRRTMRWVIGGVSVAGLLGLAAVLPGTARGVPAVDSGVRAAGDGAARAPAEPRTAVHLAGRDVRHETTTRAGAERRVAVRPEARGRDDPLLRLHFPYVEEGSVLAIEVLPPRTQGRVSPGQAVLVSRTRSVDLPWRETDHADLLVVSPGDGRYAFVRDAGVSATPIEVELRPGRPLRCRLVFPEGVMGEDLDWELRAEGFDFVAWTTGGGGAGSETSFPAVPEDGVVVVVARAHARERGLGRVDVDPGYVGHVRAVPPGPARVEMRRGVLVGVRLSGVEATDLEGADVGIEATEGDANAMALLVGYGEIFAAWPGTWTFRARGRLRDGRVVSGERVAEVGTDESLVDLVLAAE